MASMATAMARSTPLMTESGRSARSIIERALLTTELTVEVSTFLAGRDLRAVTGHAVYHGLSLG